MMDRDRGRDKPARGLAGGTRDEKSRRSAWLQRCLDSGAAPDDALALAERMERFVDAGTGVLLLEGPKPPAAAPAPRGPKPRRAGGGEPKPKPKRRARAGGIFPAHDAELRRRWKAGEHADAIGAALGCGAGTVYGRALALKLPPRKKGPRGAAPAASQGAAAALIAAADKREHRAPPNL